jgi:hypothetical protein
MSPAFGEAYSIAYCGVAGVGPAGVFMPPGLLWVTAGVLLLAVLVRSPSEPKKRRVPTKRSAKAAITPQTVPDLRCLPSIVVVRRRIGSFSKGISISGVAERSTRN